MKLRAACLADAPCLAALSIEVWLSTYIKRGVSPAFAAHALTAFTPAAFETLIRSATQFILVHDNDDGPDGFLRLDSKSPAPVPGCPDFEIATLYVQPRHQGKGIGGALVDASLRLARDAGADAVWLATNSENAPAIRFYLSRGFVLAGTTHFRIGDQAYPNDVYRFGFTA